MISLPNSRKEKHNAVGLVGIVLNFQIHLGENQHLFNPIPSWPLPWHVHVRGLLFWSLCKNLYLFSPWGSCSVFVRFVPGAWGVYCFPPSPCPHQLCQARLSSPPTPAPSSTPSPPTVQGAAVLLQQLTSPVRACKVDTAPTSHLGARQLSLGQGTVVSVGAMSSILSGPLSGLPSPRPEQLFLWVRKGPTCQL